MISIVIPTYNRPHMLEKLLESISRQTFRDYEVIVVDDHSGKTKEYIKVIKKYQNRLNHLNFIQNKDNQGAPYSRNKGIKFAQNDFIALVDDDDTWLPDKLQKQFELFKSSNHKVGLVYTWVDAVDENGKTTHRYRSCIEGGKIARKSILKEDFIPSPSVMVKKQAIMESGLFDVNFKSCQDWDMWTRMLFNGYECRVVKSVEAIYQKHCEETIGNSPKALTGYAQFYRKHFKKALFHDPILALKYLYRYLKFFFKGLS